MIFNHPRPKIWTPSAYILLIHNHTGRHTRKETHTSPYCGPSRY
jgi:hypothetical protein